MIAPLIVSIALLTTGHLNSQIRFVLLFCYQDLAGNYLFYEIDASILTTETAWQAICLVQESRLSTKDPIADLCSVPLLGGCLVPWTLLCAVLSVS